MQLCRQRVNGSVEIKQQLRGDVQAFRCEEHSAEQFRAGAADTPSPVKSIVSLMFVSVVVLVLSLN